MKQTILTPEHTLRMANDSSYAEGFADGYVHGVTFSLGVALAVMGLKLIKRKKVKR